MGLDQFNVAPDNNGGRPEGSKEDRGYSTRETDHGDPMTMDHGEDYLNDIMDRFVEGDKPTDEEMKKITDYTHLLPRSVKVELDKHGIVDYPEIRWDGKKKSSTPFFGSSSEEEEKGGIFSIVNESS